MELEVCVDSIISVKAAELGGADRLELCYGLCCDGLTPSVGFCRKVKEITNCPCYLMIRPRSGDFIYSNEELDIMVDDINNLKEYADGFVVGTLLDNGELSIDQMSALMDNIGNHPITFHRAIDSSDNPVKLLNKLIELKRDNCFHSPFRVLTSGGKSNALEGAHVIQEMVEKVKGSGIAIMAGGGITIANVQHIIDHTNVQAIHGSLSVTKGLMKCTSEDLVRHVKMIIKNFNKIL